MQSIAVIQMYEQMFVLQSEYEQIFISYVNLESF